MVTIRGTFRGYTSMVTFRRSTCRGDIFWLNKGPHHIQWRENGMYLKTVLDKILIFNTTFRR